MRMSRSTGNTDLLDMAFISPNLAKHDIQFQIGDDLGSDHLPIQVSIDAPPHRNSSANHTKYKGPVKLVKIAHSFLQSVSNQFHVIILSLPM